MKPSLNPAWWLALLGTAGAIEPARRPHRPTGNGDKPLTWNETVTSSPFSADSITVSWLAGGDEDGQYIYQADDGSLVLENIATSANETLVEADKVPAGTHEYWVSADHDRVLFATNYTKQYRHSYFADYHILHLSSGTLAPLVEDQAGDIQYAEFAPAGDAVAFVRGNNLYLSKNGSVSQITTDGGPDMFHAVPDWVYEEEIFQARSTLWFSPDGQQLAFLSFNETGVGTFKIQYFMNNSQIAPLYPRELDLRYPKAGTTNPTPLLSVVAIESEQTTPVPIEAYEADDLVIGEVAWTSSGHESFVYRAFNRVQDHSTDVRVDVGESVSSKAIRTRDGTDGWLDNNLAIQYIGAVNGSDASYYVDLSDESGWQHLYLYPTDGSESVQLTDGEWEVTSILKVDTENQVIYYLSTQRDPTERHLYSVSYKTKEVRALVDDEVPAYWSASFSSAAEYYILSYQGPDVPYQELYRTNDTSTPLRTVTSNQALWDKIEGYALPNITYHRLEHPDGYYLNVMQQLPPGFDPARKYPVLFTPYGGPGFQMVSKEYAAPAWNAFVSADPELQYVTYTVDNRGSGFQGRAFRAAVASRLGDLESADQVWAAEELGRRHGGGGWLDAAHVGIFGWSFGGYLASKVVERGSAAFTLGLIVAPVTDWRFYDSCYTERYMKLPRDNAAGYERSAVRDPEGFRRIAGGVAVEHGLGDDNVHYQNTASLLDRLVRAGLDPSQLDWRVYTDSDHSIAYGDAKVYLYRHLADRLYRERTRGDRDKLAHQWGKRSWE